MAEHGVDFFSQLDPRAQAAVARYLEPMRFPKGECLMREGDPGDGCYLVDEGEVRLEIRPVHADSESVLGYLPAGSVVGELSLLDGKPRSASAYAHSDVVARRLSHERFEALCKEDPGLGAGILGLLGRQVAAKLRHQDGVLAEHLRSDEPDEETRRMVSAAVVAQKEFATWDEARVDALLREVSEAVAAQAEALAEANVADTGIGVVADKVAKIRFACREVCRGLVGKPAAGPLPTKCATGVSEIASPAGVVLGIIPVTNPVSTIVFKTLISLKGRNALIISCLCEAMRVGEMTTEIIRGALARHKAPSGIVQAIGGRLDRRKTLMFMRHPDVAVILATGGPSIVRVAYSSGKPALGVGAGNAPVLVCADADLAAVARLVIRGKSFDNGVICGSENNLVVVEAARAELLRQMEANGAAILTADEALQLGARLFDEKGGHLKRELVGKSAAHLAGLISLKRKETPRLLVVPVAMGETGTPYGREKLAPVVSLFTVRDVDEGLGVCKRILEVEGRGHTAVIHTRDPALAQRFGLEMPASRILVNACGSEGCIGLGTGLTPSFTLGCGTLGGNSTSDNVTYTHLLNIKRLAFAT